MEKTNVLYDIAKEAKAKGLDPKSIVEISLATNLAQRAMALVGTFYMLTYSFWESFKSC